VLGGVLVGVLVDAATLGLELLLLDPLTGVVVLAETDGVPML